MEQTAASPRTLSETGQRSAKKGSILHGLVFLISFLTFCCCCCLRSHILIFLVLLLWYLPWCFLRRFPCYLIPIYVRWHWSLCICVYFIASQSPRNKCFKVENNQFNKKQLSTKGNLDFPCTLHSSHIL